MRLPSSNHAVIKVARLQKPHWDRSSHNARSFTSTVSAEAPVVIRRVDTDVPLHIIQGQPNPKAKKVAVVGGGISGLAAAHSLTKELPDAKITLFEAKNKLGGWLSSELIPVDEGEVLFEWGPRTLRNNAEALRNYNPTAQLVGGTESGLLIR